MNKKKIILDILDKQLKEQGFTYGLEKSHSGRGVWGFSREINGLTQMIIIQEHRFQKALFLEFSVSINSERAGTQIQLPEGRYNNNLDQWLYVDEEGFISTLLEFSDIIEKYGIIKLNDWSRDEVLPTNEMGEKLISAFEILSEKFIQENKLNVTAISKENILKWLDLIEEKLQMTKNEPYENVKEMLVEIAAFLGEQLRKELGGTWETGSKKSQIFLKNMNVHILNSYDEPLLHITKAWKATNAKRWKEEYLFAIDCKLPISDAYEQKLINRRYKMDQLMK